MRGMVSKKTLAGERLICRGRYQTGYRPNEPAVVLPAVWSAVIAGRLCRAIVPVLNERPFRLPVFAALRECVNASVPWRNGTVLNMTKNETDARKR